MPELFKNYFKVPAELLFQVHNDVQFQAIYISCLEVYYWILVLQSFSQVKVYNYLI